MDISTPPIHSTVSQEAVEDLKLLWSRRQPTTELQEPTPIAEGGRGPSRAIRKLWKDPPFFHGCQIDRMPEYMSAGAYHSKKLVFPLYRSFFSRNFNPWRFRWAAPGIYFTGFWFDPLMTLTCLSCHARVLSPWNKFVSASHRKSRHSEPLPLSFRRTNFPSNLLFSETVGLLPHVQLTFLFQ